MVNGFYCLRHHAVIRCNYQNRNIGGICPPHTHRCKCLMAWRIQEGNFLFPYFYGICTDMLGNTARFLIRHIRFTDGIQKGGLSMVNVPHNTDNWRPLGHILFFFLFFPQKFLDDIYLYFLFADNIVLNRNIFRIFKRKF